MIILYLSMEEEDIIKHTHAKCHVSTLMINLLIIV